MPDWQVILSRDGPAAWKAAYRVLGNRADADDCFQEACLAALEVSRREEVRNWPGLLVRLATARSLDRLRARQRARKRTVFTGLECLSELGASPPEDAEEDELVGEVRWALAQIPAKQAEAFCLHCLEDWSYEQIAQFMRVSGSAVGVLIHRARKRLRTLMSVPGTEGRSVGGEPHPLSPSTDIPCVEKEPS